MPQVNLQLLVSFSSQDPKNPAENILKGDGRKKWLSCPSDRSGKLECVIQLEKMCQISHVDIGTHYVFSVQILVGRSDWPATRDYVTLLPSTTFMTPLECRKEKHKTSVRMFSRDNFHQESFIQKWDRVKVICTQPFRKDVQLGLSLLRITTDDDISSSPVLCPTPIPKDQDPLVKGSENKYNTSGTVSAIKKHFFGKFVTEEQEPNRLQSDLAKIAATAENVSVGEALLSRNVKLVLAATAKHEKVPQREKITEIKKKITKQNIPYASEVDGFLSKLDIQTMDMNTVTFADLRQNFEMLKRKKLSRDEKKIFLKKARTFIENAVLSCDDNEYSVSNQCEVTAERESDNRNWKDLGQSNKKRKLDLAELVPSKRRVPGNYFNKLSGMSDVSNIRIDDSKKGHKMYGAKHVKMEKVNSEVSKKSDPEVVPKDGSELHCFEKFSGIPIHLKNDAIKHNLAQQVVCPLCNDLFTEEEIEIHASSCQVEDFCGTNVESDDNTPSGGEDNGQCPVCGNVFPLMQLISHVELCSVTKTFSTPE